MRGQVPLPARTDLGELRRVTTTADTNTDERSATGQRQGEGAGLGRDVGAGVGDLEVAVGENTLACGRTK